MNLNKVVLRFKAYFFYKRYNGFIFNIDIFEDIWVIQKVTNMLDRWQTVEAIITKEATIFK